MKVAVFGHQKKDKGIKEKKTLRVHVNPYNLLIVL